MLATAYPLTPRPPADSGRRRTVEADGIVDYTDLGRTYGYVHVWGAWNGRAGREFCFCGAPEAGARPALRLNRRRRGNGAIAASG